MLIKYLLLELCSYTIPGLVCTFFESKTPSTKQICDVIFKIIFIGILSRYYIYNWILDQNGICFNNLQFNFLQFILQTILYLILQDIAFHRIHLLIHLQPYYSMIHQMHHYDKITENSAILGKYMTAYDFIIFACFTYILKIIVFRSNVLYMICVDIMDYLGTLYSHSSIVPNVMKDHHYTHHKYVKCNYGMTPLSDWLFGTLRFSDS